MRELTYWNQIGALFMLEDLTLLQRNILGMIAGTKNRGLNFHDYEIANQFKTSQGAVVTALKILREKEYITTDKRKSPHRKLFASEKTKSIVKKALDEAKKSKSTHTNGIGVENSTHTNGGGVTHINGRGVLIQMDDECYIKERNNINNSANAQGEEDKSSSVAPSESNHSFNAFWAAYPKKVGRLDAEAAWKKLHPDEHLNSIIMEAIEKQKLWREQGNVQGDFRPQWKDPARWINKKCWTDEVEIKTGGNGEAVKTKFEWNDPSPEEVDEMFRRAAEVE